MIRLYHPDGSNAELCRRKRLAAGAQLAVVGSFGRMPAREIIPVGVVELNDEQLLAGNVVQIGPLEWVLYKPRWGAFFQTPLESHLRQLSVATIVLAGCNYPNCPRTTLYEASERDFRSVAIEDGISVLSEEGMRELIAIGVSVMNLRSARHAQLESNVYACTAAMATGISSLSHREELATATRCHWHSLRCS